MPKPLCQTVGRRKRAIARICFRAGDGAITVNGKPLEEYFTSLAHRTRIVEPLNATEMMGRYDVEATIDGGGFSGQAGALRLAIARALADLEPGSRVVLRRAGHLTRDDRIKESKKYGLKKARKAPQYSKR